MNPNSTRLQEFRLRAPTATHVLLVGDFTHWYGAPVIMRRERGDIWLAQVELSPGTHRYRFVVDGDPFDGPECKLEVLPEALAAAIPTPPLTPLREQPIPG